MKQTETQKFKNKIIDPLYKNILLMKFLPVKKPTDWKIG